MRMRDWSSDVCSSDLDHAGDLDINLLTPNLGKRVVRAGVVVERCSTAIGREVIGAEPVLPNDDRVTGNRTHLFHEAREMEGDLRIGRLIVGFSWSDRLCLSEAVGLYDPGDDGAAGGLKDKGGGEPGREEKRPEGDRKKSTRLNS